MKGAVKSCALTKNLTSREHANKPKITLGWLIIDFLGNWDYIYIALLSSFFIPASFPTCDHKVSVYSPTKHTCAVFCL